MLKWFWDSDWIQSESERGETFFGDPAFYWSIIASKVMQPPLHEAYLHLGVHMWPYITVIHSNVHDTCIHFFTIKICTHKVKVLDQ